MAHVMTKGKPFSVSAHVQLFENINVNNYFPEGSVLIFVTRKANSEELATNLKARDFSSKFMHSTSLLSAGVDYMNSQDDHNNIATAYLDGVAVGINPCRALLVSILAGKNSLHTMA